MARKNGIDRGLVRKVNAAGKTVWYVRIGIGGGKEKWFGSFRNKTEAKQQYQDFKGDQRKNRFDPNMYQKRASICVFEFIDQYLKIGRLKRDFKSELFFGKWWKNQLSNISLRDITPELIEKAQQNLLSEDLTPQRVNRYVGWLRKVLNLAVNKRYLPSNPISHVKLFKEPKGRVRFLTVTEEEKVMTVLGPIYSKWARLAILTGLRQEEQFSMKWSDIDLDNGVITLPHTKTGDCQYIHLNTEAKNILRSFNSWQRSMWVFPSKNHSTHIDPRNFYGRVWMPAVESAGIPRCTWHDLRHTFASRLAMNGFNENTIATLLRHSGTALVRRYAHLSPSFLKKAVESLALNSQTNSTTEADKAEYKLLFSDRDKTVMTEHVSKTGIV